MLLGYIDLYTGYEFSFSIFYLIPITFTVLYADFRFSIVISIISAAFWLFADIYSGHKYQNTIYPVWNTFMRLGYFLLHSFFLSKFLILYKITKQNASIDLLTNAVNSRFFHELLNQELKKSQRNKRPFTLIYMDLDNFKSVNDTYGHLAGDSLLKLISSLIIKNVRTSDIFARLGGDEFALFLPETGFEESKQIIKRLKQIADMEFSKNNWNVSLSIGAVTFKTFNLSVEEMILQTDNLMYKVKKKGKNNIEHNLRE
ncbi:MAG: GGDEF domain-containing protein [Leptospiraceae bacterium]|nr:GGDEF domain-containing protein [Leptospiraceae bacterium]MCP5495636.1 GGDEF domain-containing protein [Leptospiraceae bacterium]